MPDHRPVGAVEGGANLKIVFQRQIERLDRGEASTTHGLPVPVIYDEDELACQGGGGVHEPVI